MIISNLGIDYIKGWEKFRSKAYLDQAKIWTIGYGTTRYFGGAPIKKGDVITISRATTYIIAKCEGIVMKLNVWLKHEWNQNEFDAMVSLAYNIGTQGFRSSTLLRELNKDGEILENYFTRWNKITIDGKLVPSRGLTRRRKSEWKLFSECDYTGNS
jgi:lysozyme